MKNQTIHLGLKIKNNTLQFKGENIFKFKTNNNILTEYIIDDTISHLKRYLSYSMKMYIKTSYEHKITINNGHILIDLWCLIDGERVKSKIEFITFIDNKITYLG